MKVEVVRTTNEEVIYKHWELMNHSLVSREPEPSALVFSYFIRQGYYRFYSIYVDGVLSGSIWLSDFMYDNMCQVHFDVYRTDMMRQADEVGRKVLEYVKNDTGYTSLVGLLPKANKRAQAFAKRLGLKYKCVLEKAEYIESANEYRDLVLFSTM